MAEPRGCVREEMQHGGGDRAGALAPMLAAAAVPAGAQKGTGRAFRPLLGSSACTAEPGRVQPEVSAMADLR